MKTVYYKTSHFIEHSGNLVDLDEFRAKLDLAQRDSLARQPRISFWSPEAEAPEEPAFHPVVLTITRAQRRRARRERRAWTLDACASLAVIAMTLLFALYMAL